MKNRRLDGHSPDDETGKGGTKEGVGQDGAEVPEEVSLQVRETDTVEADPAGQQDCLEIHLLQMLACPAPKRTGAFNSQSANKCWFVSKAGSNCSNNYS